jgi:SpoVK/Ycf46/Vps4 family AAA+-type ATPase
MPATTTQQDLLLNYGVELVRWEVDWLKRISLRPSGVTILNGPPGAGKTSYLRSLIARLAGEFVFYYLPVSSFDLLVNPQCVGFWLEEYRLHKNKTKIAILEDAEDLLLPRDEHSRTKVNNLLNIADGFLGEHLKLQVMATTNAPRQQLQEALLRPGRLVGMREFRRLTRPEALRLARAKGLDLPEQPDYSLAEIYNRRVDVSRPGEARRVGFG